MTERKIDTREPSWIAVQERAQAAINQALLDLKQDQPENSTTRLRARIRAFEDVLTWANAEPDIQTEELHFGLGD